jgi:hypothetical protein
VKFPLVSNAREAARAARLLSRLLILTILMIPAILNGCLQPMAGKGGGTETESKVVAGHVVNPDGSPTVAARVTVRTSDYLADPVSPADENEQSRETFTDVHGQFHLDGLPAGSYRAEIAGSESGGLVRDFSLAAKGQGYDIPLDTLRPRGGIMGAFAPDSDAQLASFVQVYGMERLVKADPTGAFLIGNLPPGSYDIRCNSLQPFRRDAVIRGIQVKPGQVTHVEPVALAKEAKLTFRVDSAGLRIDGMDASNPIILDNEIWADGIETEYIWAKASLGALNLRGNIVTGDIRAVPGTTVAAQMDRAREEMRVAKLAGLTNLAEMIPGAENRLVAAPSGRVEDIEPVPTPGSDFIVAEARKATPEKPLIVIVGGPLTTVAQAYLTDPSIAARMVIAGAFTLTIQSYDSAANYLTARKCRFVEWGYGYVWAGRLDTTRLDEIPLSGIGGRVRNHLYGNRAALAFGDLAPAAYLFNPRVWKTANMVKISSNLSVQPASDITFDFLNIPATANDWNLYQDEVFATLGNPDVYKPKALPGLVEAEGYLNQSGASAIAPDSAGGFGGVACPAGTWAEYKVSAASAGKFSIVFHYRSGAGGRISIGHPGAAALGGADLAPSIVWAEAAGDSISLEAGTSVLRVESAAGKIDLTGIDFR